MDNSERLIVSSNPVLWLGISSSSNTTIKSDRPRSPPRLSYSRNDVYPLSPVKSLILK